MKFGKQLRAIVDSSYEEWRPMFMSYKVLKKTIAPPDELASTDSDSRGPNDTEPDPSTIISTNAVANKVAVQNAERRHSLFFTRFKKEVDKVNDFFLDKQEDYIIEHAQLSAKVAEFLQPARATRAEVNHLRQRLTDFHGELVLLENYSTVNYTGFRKILKKHDKKTGLSMHQIYLNTVLVTPFFLSDTVRKLILKTEAQLADLEGITKFRRADIDSLALERPPQTSLNPSANAAVRAPHAHMVLEAPRPHAFISPRSALWRLYRDARDHAAKLRETTGAPRPAQSLVDLVDCVDARELGLEHSFLRMVSQPSNYTIAGDEAFSMGFFVFPKGVNLQLFRALRGGMCITKLLRGHARLRCYKTCCNQSASTAPSENGNSETNSNTNDFCVEETRSAMITGPWPAVTCYSETEHAEYIAETDCAVFYVCAPTLGTQDIARFNVHPLTPPLHRVSYDVQPTKFSCVSCC